MGRFVSGIGIRILIVLVVAGGAFVLRDRLSGNAGDLKAGDCFDDVIAETIEDVQHHPCSEAHTAEVVRVENYPAGNGAPYPADDFASYDDTCTAAGLNYVGGNANPDVIFTFYAPLESGWAKGDRQMICYVTTQSQTKLTKSLKATQ